MREATAVSLPEAALMKVEEEEAFEKKKRKTMEFLFPFTPPLSLSFLGSLNLPDRRSEGRIQSHTALWRADRG